MHVQIYLSEAIGTNKDKQTKILAAECLYHLSQIQSLDESVSFELRDHVTVNVSDVKIYSILTYVTVTDNLYDKQDLAESLLEFLPILYAAE